MGLYELVGAYGVPMEGSNKVALSVLVGGSNKVTLGAVLLGSLRKWPPEGNRKAFGMRLLT